MVSPTYQFVCPNQGPAGALPITGIAPTIRNCPVCQLATELWVEPPDTSPLNIPGRELLDASWRKPA